MVFEGRIENGVIVLDHPQPLPDGARVRVEVLAPGANEGTSAFRRLFGSVSVGPPDGSNNDAIDADIARSYADGS